MIWVAGHFGEWLQGCLGGEVVLVTLACPVRGASVGLRDAPGLVLDDPAGVFGAARAGALLAALGLPVAGQITAQTDMPPGAGAGMSTAALVALARAAGAEYHAIARACLQVEGAVDPLMLPAPDACLWAPRMARSRRPLPPPPEAAILGGLWGGPVITDPADQRFPEIADLIETWARAPDLPAAAALASQSAARTTALRGPDADPTAALAARFGALGWARAHTGAARALIFPPGAVPPDAEAEMQRAGYSHVLQFRTGGRG